MKTLCETFPTDAHFWNHLGRHLNFIVKAPYVEAERCFLRAIELDSKNEIHHHGLGMVYRFEVRRRLEQPLDRSQSLLERLAALESIFGQAEQSFRTARKLEPGSDYALVTHVQMIIESIERIFNLVNVHDYKELLNRTDYIGDWCRSKLQRAEVLLDEIKRIQAEVENSKFALEFESKLSGLYGNFEAMVRGLTELLNRHDINERSVRRLIAHCHIRHNRNDLDRIEKRTVHQIADMMLENLAEDPGNDADMRLWLRAFRMLPEFTITEALERVSTWAVASDSLDAHYYLYILNYVHLVRGAHASQLEVRKNIEVCLRRAPLLLSKRSFEWWASEALHRPCPLVHNSELESWRRGTEYWANADKLRRVEGIVDEIRSPQHGTCLIHGLPVFFVPARLVSSADVNTKVSFHLGFSYEGLRAWNVQNV